MNVSQDYIEGIKEGRATHSLILARGEKPDLAREAARCRRFLARLARGRYPGAATDFAKGELDFWENQTKQAAP